MTLTNILGLFEIYEAVLFLAFPCGLMCPPITPRSMQEVHILKNVKLIDSPGVLASPSNPPASMALRSLQVEEGRESVLEAVRTLLKQCDKIQVGRFPNARETQYVKLDKSVILDELGCSLVNESDKGILKYLSLLFQIMLQYNIPDYKNSLEFLSLFAKKRGYLQKGGVPNTEQAATAFLDDWTG